MIQCHDFAMSDNEQAACAPSSQSMFPMKQAVAFFNDLTRSPAKFPNCKSEKIATNEVAAKLHHQFATLDLSLPQALGLDTQILGNYCPMVIVRHFV